VGNERGGGNFRTFFLGGTEEIHCEHILYVCVQNGCISPTLKIIADESVVDIVHLKQVPRQTNTLHLCTYLIDLTIETFKSHGTQQ
jgi:hypothetical protein